MAYGSTPSIRQLIDQMGRDYDSLEETKTKLSQDCTKLREQIDQQMDQISNLNQEFEKLRQEYSQRKSDIKNTSRNVSAPAAGPNPSDEPAERECEIESLYSNDDEFQKATVALLAEIVDVSVICSTAFSPDDKYIAIGSDHTLRVYNVETSRFDLEFSIQEGDVSKPNHVRSLAWTKDSKRIICGVEDKFIRVIDFPSGSLISSFQAGEGEVFQIETSHDGSFFASVTSDGFFSIWKLDDYTKIASLQPTSHEEPNSATSLSISDDDTVIAVGYTDKTVCLWSVETLQLITTIKAHSKGVYSVKFFPGSKRLATSSLDNTVKIWDVEEKEKGKLTLSLWKTLTNHENFVLTLAVDPKGLWLISGSKDMTIKITSIEIGKMVYNIKAHTNSVISVAFNSQGNMFCSGSGDHAVLVWSITVDQPEE